MIVLRQTRCVIIPSFFRETYQQGAKPNCVLILKFIGNQSIRAITICNQHVPRNDFKKVKKVSIYSLKLHVNSC